MSDMMAVKAELAKAELVGFRIDKADGGETGAGKFAAARSGATKLGHIKPGLKKTFKPRPIA
jgi:hypothetical protein